MKLRINESQLNLLTNNFIIVEDGLSYDDKNLINESMRVFKVLAYFNGWPSTILVGASSPSTSLILARLMFPKARITSHVTVA